MDKYIIRSSSTLEQLDDSFIKEESPFTLGVIGYSSSSFWSKESILSNIINPLLDELKQSPESILLPSDGHTSLLLESWAEINDVKVTAYSADWKSLGRRARALRDSRIIKESSHLLFFIGSRSDYYEKMAIREVKKGKIVYTVDPSSKDLIQWIL